MRLKEDYAMEINITGKFSYKTDKTEEIIYPTDPTACCDGMPGSAK